MAKIKNKIIDFIGLKKNNFTRPKKIVNMIYLILFLKKKKKKKKKKKSIAVLWCSSLVVREKAIWYELWCIIWPRKIKQKK